MPTKAELVALADGLRNQSEATSNGHAMTTAQGVQALSRLSDDEFEERLAQLKKGRERIARAQREYMVVDEDYGTIPNTPKPTLFKSGAEKLAQLYGLAARVETRFESGDNEKTPPLTFYAEAFLHVGSFDGPIVAVGHGTANSWEKRYRRDTKSCPNCGEPKIIKSKYDPGWYCLNCKSKYRPDDESITSQTSGPSDITTAYDLGVTLLKMSEKRAFVDAVLRATASSGLFTQDVAEEVAESVPAASAPQSAAPEPTVTITRDAVQPPDNADDLRGMNEAFVEKVIEVTGGTLEPETVNVGPSKVENVERGGRTSGANDAQIAEVRRLLGELHWGAKAGLGYTLNTLEIEGDVPADGRVARSQLTELLDNLGSTQIGLLIQKLSNEVEMDKPFGAPVVTA